MSRREGNAAYADSGLIWKNRFFPYIEPVSPPSDIMLWNLFQVSDFQYVGTMIDRLQIYTALIALACVASTTSVFAQDANIRLRLAQAYEQAGEHKRAVQIYEELFAKDSSSYVLFDGLRRGYLNLKRYDEAIRIIERRLAGLDKNLNLAAMLGEAYYRAGDERRAFETWKDALAADAKNPQAYRFIANFMTQNRLFEHAIDVYKRGRGSCGDPSLFINELSSLYAIVMNYGKATHEYLRMLSKNPSQLNHVETRISTYTGKPEGLVAAITVVETELKSKPDVLWLWHLLAWLHLEGKQFDKAYVVYRTIDDLSKARGKELFAFADRAFREKAYVISSHAFREVLETYPNFKLRMSVQYGLARSIEELSRLLSDSIQRPISLELAPDESKPSFQRAVELYAEVAEAQPRSHLAAQSLYQIGLIRMEQLLDLDGALVALESGEQAAPGTPTSFEIGVMIGEVWVAKGDIEKAEQKWNRLSGNRGFPPDLRQKVSFKLAELDYYRGRFDDAVKKLEEFSQDPLLDFTNDALLLHTLIRENRLPSEEPLRLYARAEFMAKQRKYSEAIESLRKIMTEHAASFLDDEALMNIAMLQTVMENFEQAITSYEQLIADFGDESVLLDRAQLKIAEIYQFHLRIEQKAIEAYQRLLEQNPNSIYAAQARKRIRQLRGDSI